MSSLLCAGIVTPLVAAPPAITAVSPPAVQVGTTATLALAGKPGNAPIEVWCDRPELSVSMTGEKPQLQVEVPADAVPGLCWLRFYNAEGCTAPVPLLVGVLPQVDDKEPNNLPREAQELKSLPVAVQGVLHKSGEVDTYAVTLSAGQQLIASVAAFEAFASPMDGVLQIVSDEGYVVEQNDDHHSNDPQIEFVAPRDGVWYVRVFAFPATPNSTIGFAGGDDYRYRLSLTTGPFVDHVIHHSDGTSQLIGWNLQGNEDLKQLPGLHLWRSSNVTSAPIQSANARLTPGTVHTGELATPQASYSGAFSATKGTNYRIRVTAQALGSILDPVLSIADTDGKVLKDSDDIGRDNRDVDLIWKAPSDGEFTLKVTDRFGHGSPRHFFELLVEVDQPRVALTLEAAQFDIKRGKPLEIPVTIARSGFADPLTVTVVGLPDGVTVTAATSEPKGDSSKSVKLKLEAGAAAAFNGPVRIVARSSADEQAAEITTATASLPVSGWSTSVIWLTIPPEPEEKK